MADSTHQANFKVMWDNQRFAKATSKIEGVTGIFAQHMIAQAGMRDYPKEAPLVILENACGGAIMTLQLQAILQDRPRDTFEINCGDLADAMVALTQQRVKAEGWTNTSVAKFDAEDTKFPNKHFTHVFTNFGFMAFANPSQALSECHRVLRPGGTCAFTTWGSTPRPSDTRAAMESVPSLPRLPAEMDVPKIFSKVKIWHDSAAVEDFVTQHNLINVESRLVRAVSVSENLEELKAILKPPSTLMMTFFWTQEQRDMLDNPTTYDKVFAWFESKFRDGPYEWEWSAVVTTCTKPA